MTKKQVRAKFVGQGTLILADVTIQNNVWSGRYCLLEGLNPPLLIKKDSRKKNSEAQIGTYALHLQPSYEKVKKIGKLERSEELYRNLLALPMCHSMRKKDQEYIVSEIEKFLKQRN